MKRMAESIWKSRFHPRWMLLALLAAGGVLGLTHIPGEDMPRILSVNDLDKVEHVVAYGLIAGFLLLALKKPVRPVVLLAALAALAVLGALDETTQPLVHRTCDLWDYVGDLTGVALSCAVFLIITLTRPRATAP
jgi:hypothetical protein